MDGPLIPEATDLPNAARRSKAHVMAAIALVGAGMAVAGLVLGRPWTLVGVGILLTPLVRLLARHRRVAVMQANLSDAVMRGDTKGAIRGYIDGLGQIRDHVLRRVVLMNLAHAYAVDGQMERALSVVRHADLSAGSSRDAFGHLCASSMAFYLALLGRIDEAHATCEEARARVRAVGRATLTDVVLLLRSAGSADRALDCLESWRSLSHELPRTTRFAADALAAYASDALGRPLDAYQDFLSTARAHPHLLRPFVMEWPEYRAFAERRQLWPGTAE